MPVATTVQSVLHLGIIGCGDVLFRSYAEGIRAIAGDARIVACCDPSSSRAEAAAQLCGRSGPVPRIHGRHESMLASEELDAVVNLTPAPLHFSITRDALDQGLHVYSEKPLASTLEEADELLTAALDADRLLLCAPAVMATSRFRWLSGLLESGRLGGPRVAVGQLATLGPAAWRAYSGDPRVFYGDAVGPVPDLGVYLLHAVTGLMGPASRVLSLETIAIPERRILGRSLTGERFTVDAPDLVSILLEFPDGSVAQLLCGFAVPGTRTPFLEVHCSGGSVSTPEPFAANGGVDVWLSDESTTGMEGWVADANAAAPPSAVEDMIACGIVHFVDCLLSREEPVLTAEHARHVLEIRVRARRAAERGIAEELQTSFPWPGLPATVDARAHA
jgi:predicted dehydrogenase